MISRYATSDNTATMPDDYTFSSGLLNWADGDSADKTFTVNIVNDLDPELSEIVNLTIVPAGASLNDVVAFDVGPCNMLMDGLSEILLDRPRDDGGEVAGTGRPSTKLIEQVLQHPFYVVRPPKSTGRELFGDRFTVPNPENRFREDQPDDVYKGENFAE